MNLTPPARLMAACVAAVLIAFALGNVRAEPAPLRQVDWGAVLAADPHVEILDPCPVPLVVNRLGPCVRVRAVIRAATAKPADT